MKLTDFPFSETGFGRSVYVFGIGSAGCRIENQLAKECKKIERFLYISPDEQDLVFTTRGTKLKLNQLINQERTPYAIRGAINSSDLAELSRQLVDSRLLIIVSGLGGAVGSALAPLLVKELTSGLASAITGRRAKVLTILVMPHALEKPKLFYAGSALNHIRKYASAIVIVDNDDLLAQQQQGFKENEETNVANVPLIDSYSIINQNIAATINTLLSPIGMVSKEKEEEQQNGFKVSDRSVIEENVLCLERFIAFVESTPYSILDLSHNKPLEFHSETTTTHETPKNSISTTTSVTASTVTLTTTSTVQRKEKKEEVGSVVVSSGRSLRASQHYSVVPPASLHVVHSLSETKFANYDPIDQILGPSNSNLDEGMDSALPLNISSSAKFKLPNLED